MTTGDTTWKVTAQQETSEIDANGQLVPVISVGFVTGRGVAGTVTIPKSQYNVDTVRDAIMERAQTLDSIAQLTS